MENINKELEDKIDALHERYPEVSFAKLTRICVSMSKWQNEKTIERACKWLEEHADGYTWYNEMEGESGMVEDFIKDFKEGNGYGK